MGFFNKFFKKKEEIKKEENKALSTIEKATDEKEVKRHEEEQAAPREEEQVKKHEAEQAAPREEGQVKKHEEEQIASREEEQVKKHEEEQIAQHEEEPVEHCEEESLDREEQVNAEEGANQEAQFELEEEKHEAKEEQPEPEVQQKKGIFSKLFNGLAKTRDNLLHSVDEVLKGFKKIDEELYEELEEALIVADFGVDTTLKIMGDLRSLVKERKITEPSALKDTLAEIITNILTSTQTKPIIQKDVPNVILVIGVNGAGKTTTIGKMANQLKEEGNKVVLAAADTFRAAAIEQLQIWADRAQVDLIKHDEGSDPAAVVFDGIKAAKARKADVLICDTAGRLQNKTNLMKELEKISRIIEREYPEAHKEVLIVLDATTGQNAISQVKIFKEAAHVDGIVLTKLDGTAKGGAIVGICQSMNVPVKYIGVGEKIEDLQVFEPESFAKALFAKDEN